MAAGVVRGTTERVEAERPLLERCLRDALRRSSSWMTSDAHTELAVST